VFWQVVLRVEQSAKAILGWSLWRRWHQAWARWHHYERRARAEPLLPQVAAVVPQAVIARQYQRRGRAKPPPARAVVAPPAGVAAPEETDVVWRRLEALLPPAERLGRPYKYERRLVLEALVYLMHNDCGWQQLPARFPPWPTVAAQLRQWRKQGIWEQIWAGLEQPHASDKLQL
jgi:Putative transposase of IS4/5 family (DUF4096)